MPNVIKHKGARLMGSKWRTGALNEQGPQKMGEDHSAAAEATS